jgi:hypothetical protein
MVTWISNRSVRKRAFTRSILILILPALLSSCFFGKMVETVTKKIDLKYVTPAAEMYADSTAFKGLRDFITEAGQTSNILLVHGLTDKKPDHFDFLIERLAYRLDLKLLGDPIPVDLGQIITNDTSKRELGFGKWQLFEWQFESPPNGRRVNMYFLYWAPITSPAKKFIQAYNRTDYRTRLSTLAKDSLFIDLFGDLALSLNPSYEVQLHTAFLESMERIKGGPVAVVGNGFGVQLLFEAMTLELDRRNKPVKAVVDHELVQAMEQKHRSTDIVAFEDQAQYKLYSSTYDISKVFLISNQLPFTSLLALRYDDVPQGDSLNNRIYWAFNNFAQHKRKAVPTYNLAIVSFFDPNDPFGYRLPRPVRRPITVCNISVNVAEYWSIDPVLATQFLLPRIKDKKTADFVVGMIDQQASTQQLMINIKAPAEQSRNDYRIIGALVEGYSDNQKGNRSGYGLICLGGPSQKPRARQLTTPHHEQGPIGTYIAEKVIRKIERRLQVKRSVLPFSLPSTFRDTDPIMIRAKDFHGIDLSVAQNELTQIITVHGVKNQEPEHFDELTSGIATSLGFYSRPHKSRVVCTEGENCSPNSLSKLYSPGSVRITEYTGVYGKKLIVYQVYWSSITKPVKAWLDSISTYQEGSVIPKLLKQTLITDGFADIELTFRGMKNVVQKTIQTAFHEAEKDAITFPTATTPNTYFITGSLGTRLLLEYIGTARSNDSRVNQTMRRVASWFALTNQLVMIGVKDMKLDSGKISYEDFYKSIFHPLTDSISAEYPQPAVVSFNDPNDILSFVVPDEVMGVDGRLTVSNNYLNLAQGFNINMDELIHYAYKADTKFKDAHLDRYKLTSANQSDGLKVCETIVLAENDPASQDYVDILDIGRQRFALDFRELDERRQRNRQSSRETLNLEVRKGLMATPRDLAELRGHLNEKRRWCASDLYLTDSQEKRFQNAYERARSELKAEFVSRHRFEFEQQYPRKPVAERKLRKGSKKFSRKALISENSCRKLMSPGVIMPFLRTVTNFRLYQDFVVDFGKAHMGDRGNKKVIEMISHGFDDTKTTNVDQKMYRRVHNPIQR